MSSSDPEKGTPNGPPSVSVSQPVTPAGPTPSGRLAPTHLSPPPTPHGSALPRSLASRRRASTSMQAPHGIPIPSHMAPPLADGYRTPTYEDYEMHFRQPMPQPDTPALASRCETPEVETADGVDEARSAASHVRSRMVRIHFPHLHAHGHHNKSHHIRLSKQPPYLLRSPLSFEAISDALDERLEWRQRIRHFTWNFFSLTMATGGIANVLYSVPYKFNGLYGIGVFFFLFNLIIYVLFAILITVRFLRFPETLKASFTHPTESLFMPSAVVSFATVLLNICQYGVFHTGPWLNEAVIVFFWIFVVMAILTSSGIYLLMWSTQTFTIARMTPVWIFPAYPLLVVGPLAALLGSSPYTDQPRALDILITGFVCQGIGFLVSMTIYSAFIYRLMTQKLPQENVRPGMFVSVGPSGFTCAAIAGLAANAPFALPDDFMGDGHLAGMILKVVGNFACLWFWGLALWFFIISVGAHWTCLGRGSLQFGMTWFSFVFPNTALITATFAIGKAFGSPAISIVGCVATCGLIIVWLLVFLAMAHAIGTKKILWPQKGEDRDEGGFKAPEMRRPSRPSITAATNPA